MTYGTTTKDRISTIPAKLIRGLRRKGVGYSELSLGWTASFQWTPLTRGGTLTTPPLIFTGDRLALNVDTGAGGILRAEIQSADGEPVEGYTLADSDEHNGNSVSMPGSFPRTVGRGRTRRGSNPLTFSDVRLQTLCVSVYHLGYFSVTICPDTGTGLPSAFSTRAPFLTL